MLFSLLLTTADIMVFWSGYRIHERLLKVNVRRRRRREPIKDGKKRERRGGSRTQPCSEVLFQVKYKS